MSYEKARQVYCWQASRQRRACRERSILKEPTRSLARPAWRSDHVMLLGDGRAVHEGLAYRRTVCDGEAWVIGRPRLDRFPSNTGDPKRHARLLELLSGTGSIGRAFDSPRWDVVSVDNDPRAHATRHCDINGFDWRCVGKVHVIWASPPCTNYSRARPRGGARDLETSDSLVRKTLEIAEALGILHALLSTRSAAKSRTATFYHISTCARLAAAPVGPPIGSGRLCGPTPRGTARPAAAHIRPAELRSTRPGPTGRPGPLSSRHHCTRQLLPR